MQDKKERPAAIVLFDGVCNLCSGSVRFIIKRDPEAYFRFASLQSVEAEDILSRAGRSVEEFDSVVLIEQDRLFTKSEAALHIAARLNGLWSLTKVFLVVPRKIRDRVYDWIARNRFDWFGKKDVCWKPEEQLQNRFLDT